ncbi:MarR family transcriptional regulator [Maribacter algarum]|uniref:MarR family transcriptional regulator n=1 Tax=Maribacter algarum (ex Zhang et al. 2020) TaxID=2578118 RepID=A0A5S3PNQ6_9FLAO|nr:MarR family transcriptional regulator [Maribacter algarum]TMM56056.1 MarR family transcriptional regulator [Maribacter algarum]
MNVEQIIKTEKKIPLERRTIIHFMLVNNKINESISKALKPFDVSLQQFNVLRILRGQNEKPANLSTLNERMVTKMSNTTRLVDKLILKGFVDRIICPSNRRKVEISITTEGRNILKKIDSAMIKAEKSILENISKKELEQLNTLLNKF